MKTTFEDRLLDALKHEVEESAADRPAPVARRAVTPRRMTLGLAACAAAATVGVVLPGTQGGSAAYAVEKHQDGTVTVTVTDLTMDRAEQKALAEKLRGMGVRADIQNPAKGFMCADPGRTINGVYHYGTAEREYQEAREAGQTFPPDPESENPWSVTLRPADTLVIRNVQAFKNEFVNFGLSTQWFGTRGKAALCRPQTLDLHPVPGSKIPGPITKDEADKVRSGEGGKELSAPEAR